MSTDYEIRCSCGSSYTRDNWRIPEEVDMLLSLRKEFTTVGKKVSKVLGTRTYLGLDGWDVHGSMFPGIFDFFVTHEHHEMVIYDEYGKRWLACPDGKHDIDRTYKDYKPCRVCRFVERES